MQMRLDKVMQQALGDSADFFPKWDIDYGMAK
jgi:hypothetical protein